MSTAKSGDTVHVHYTGTLTDGSIFDSSEGREPLVFKLGEGQVVPGFEAGVLGMSVGQSRTFEIAADQAYGAHNPELVLEVPRAQMPPDMQVEIGDELALQHPSGMPIPVVVVAVGDETILLDANHPLAGEDLTFAVELVKIDGPPSLIIIP